MVRVKEIEGEHCVVMEDNEIVLWDKGGKRYEGERGLNLCHGRANGEGERTEKLRGRRMRKGYYRVCEGEEGGAKATYCC